MKPPEWELLVDGLIKNPGRHERELMELRRLAEQARNRPEVVGWLEDLARELPADGPPPLQAAWELALLGLCLGFLERELSPFVEAHRAVIGPMLEDIRSVHTELAARQPQFDREMFGYRAFQYGIHRAYYLDWTLYLSHEPY